MEKLLTMSAKELSRLEVMQRLEDKRLKQKGAAEILGLSVRQIKRLLGQYREAGASGLVSRRRESGTLLLKIAGAVWVKIGGAFTCGY